MKNSMTLAKPQRHYNGPALLAVCTTISMILWLGYDMIIPAMPTIGEAFGVTGEITNLMLFPFLIAQAIGSLITGSISDRFGRKRILRICIIVFFICSVVCALAPNIYVLILVRIPCGFVGGACMISLLTIVTDSYRGHDFDFAMTIMQSLPVIGPIAAPFLGSLMMMLFSWQAVFILLGALGGVAVILVLLMDETLPPEERMSTSVGDSLRAMVPICREPGFLPTAFVVAIIGMLSMAFLAVSPYILIEQMSVGYLEYSIIYALTVGAGILSAMLYLRVQGKIHESYIAWFCIVVCVLCGVMFLIAGPLGPIGVLLACVPLLFIESIVRAQGLIALTQHRAKSRGAANSVATFLYSSISALGTEVASLFWQVPLLGIGAMTIVCGLVAAGIWVYLTRSGKMLPRYR